MKESQGIQVLLDQLLDAEKDLLGRHPTINSLPYNALNEGSSERIYLNSDGALRQARRTQATVYLMARAEESGRKPRSGGAVRLALGSRELDLSGCIDEAAERTISHLNYKPIDTGRYLVCFTQKHFST